MKYTDKKATPPEQEKLQPRPGRDVPRPTQMQSQSDELSDKLQADVVNGCCRVLLALDARQDLKSYVKTDEAEKIIGSLQDFHYTIGFAGGQSSGKSTVVNAMLQYPLMPTCQAATTCTPVELFFSERIRITVSNADTGEQLLDYPCDRATDEDFDKLKEYACAVSALPQVIENLQPFVDGYVGSFSDGIHPDQLDMTKEDPRHVAVLLMMLLTVYVKQNLEELSSKQEDLIQLRNKTMAYFKLPADVPNIYVRIQWDSPILRSGLRILDLPGLGANAEDKKLDNGKVLKGHDTITKDTIAQTDTMVVVQNPAMLASVLATVEQMVSNLKVKEAVVENCIVPVLNKVDTCVGDAGRQGAIQDFQTMLQNVGIQKKKEDIFCLSAVYGEYAYEGCDRTLFCEKQLQRLREKGLPQAKLQSRKELLQDDLSIEYENSGVEALREFFRTAFIERGKLEKSFSTIAEVRALGKDAQSGILAKKRLYEGFVGSNQALAEEALPKLKEAAQTPIDRTLTLLEKFDIASKISRMSSCSDLVVQAYQTAFQQAGEEYIKRNKEDILDKMALTWVGFGSYARVDDKLPRNNLYYREFLKESQCVYVNMTQVNKRYAEVLSYVKADIQEIFDNGVSQLYSFADHYEPVLKATIGEYQASTSTEVMEIFDSIIPVISEFVTEQIEIAEKNISRSSMEVEQAQLTIANTIIRKNQEFVSSIKDYALEHTQMKTNNFWLLGQQEKMRIDGDGGAKKAVLEMGKLIGENPTVETNIREICSAEIINPMQKWYPAAKGSVEDAFLALQDKIEELLDGIEQDLKSNTSQIADVSKKLDEDRIQISKIFDGLRNSIRDSVPRALPMARERNIVSKKFAGELDKWMSGGDSVDE